MTNKEFWDQAFAQCANGQRLRLANFSIASRQLTGNAWVADQNPHAPDRRLQEVWDKQRDARNAFLAAIGAPVEQPKSKPD